MVDLNWRPAAASMHNLVWFWLALTLSTSTVVASRGDREDRSTLAALLALAVVGGLLVALTWSRPRFFRALEAAAHPRVRNWPPSPSRREAAARAAAGDARKAAAAAVVIGVVAAFVPLVGPAVAAAGAAGFAGTLLVLRAVRRYERAHHETVLTLAAEGAGGAGDAKRRQLVVAVVPEAPSDAGRLSRH